MKTAQGYIYQTFNKENWNYNVDRFFFLVLLNMVYSFAIFKYSNFNVQTSEIVFRSFLGVFVIISYVGIIEAICATVTKIALTPGCLLDGPFSVLRVFYKTFVTSICKYWINFKQVNYPKKAVISAPCHGFILTNIIGSSTSGISRTYTSDNIIQGYLKEPETFK